MSIFGGLTSRQTHNRNLVEFKAGKMTLRGNMVYPDKRKGLVYLYQANDMLMHLCWKERSRDTPEDDLVIFPEEIEFKEVTQNTTGRVYVLKWRANSRKMFFWMQEPTDDKDEEFCEQINDLLNHPPTSGSDDNDMSPNILQPFMEQMARSGGSGGRINRNDLSQVLSGMNPMELATLLHSFGSGSSGPTGSMQGTQRGRGSTQQGTNPSQQTADSRPNTAPAGATTTSTNRSGGDSSASAKTSKKPSGPKSGPIQINALTNVLSNLTTQPTQETGTASSKSTIDLYDNITHENLVPLLSNKDVQEKLRIHLPEGHTIPNTEEEMREIISSAQFRQLVNAFSTALQAGELTTVLSQFNFPNDVIQAINQGDLLAFAQAIEKHYNTMDTQ